MNWYEYNEGQPGMENVVNFERPKPTIEHVDKTTIVEKTEMTPEIRKLFETTYSEALARAEGEKQ